MIKQTPSPAISEASKIINPIEPSLLPGLDSEFVDYYNRTIGTKVPTHQIDIEKIRANPEAHRVPWSEDTSNDKDVRDVSIASKDGFEFGVRVYAPDTEKAGQGPFPVHLNFHGGGFVFGDLSSDGTFCKYVRDRLSIVVVDVDYRLCPENAYGRHIEDAWAALNWVYTHETELNIRRNSISIGGISAGASISTILQHLARDAGIKLKVAILAVPPVDWHSWYEDPSESPFESLSLFRKSPSLDWLRISYFHRYLKPDKDIPEWWLSPLKAPDFSGLSDTCVFTAEYDPLRDEGEAFLGVPHPFVHMPLKKAKDYENEACLALILAHELYSQK
ncbi:hypothetical protein B2J93_3311 [Marssonina coronariae]|uniref:Alpha/beta hydrolase fold-3 domain-containing protein n=1 Tax=Diplocarpon coronariae TaxID=2795749 RepID=A0A218ZC57_9HELO|nr:hypothetical protein B2J93_3311 [Marssonina coronariae]